MSAYSIFIPSGRSELARPRSLEHWRPVYGQPPDGEVGRRLSILGRLYRGEFHDEIC